MHHLYLVLKEKEGENASSSDLFVHIAEDSRLLRMSEIFSSQELYGFCEK